MTRDRKRKHVACHTEETGGRGLGQDTCDSRVHSVDSVAAPGVQTSGPGTGD